VTTKVDQVKDAVYESWLNDALALQASIALASMDQDRAREVADRLQAGDFSCVIDEDSGEIEFVVSGDLLFSAHVSDLRSPSWLGLD
jgi:hypothetical protein